MFITCSTYVLTVSPFGNPWQNHTNKWNMREVINHSTHTHLLNTIKFTLIQTLEKLCKKRVHGMEDFDNLYFWNTLNKTHQGIFLWNRNERLHTINKKHVYKEKKETTHGEMGENVITTSSNIYIYISIMNTKFAITKWSQDQYTRTVYLKDKEKKRYKKSSLHPSK